MRCWSYHILFTGDEMTKAEQTKWNKKPKRFVDKDYMAWLHKTQRCYVCYERGGLELHHIRSPDNRTRNDNEIVPLCDQHHRGSQFSVHGTPAHFLERYPYDTQYAVAERLYRMYKNAE